MRPRQPLRTLRFLFPLLALALPGLLAAQGTPYGQFGQEAPPADFPLHSLAQLPSPYPPAAELPPPHDPPRWQPTYEPTPAIHAPAGCQCRPGNVSCRQCRAEIPNGSLWNWQTPPGRTPAVAGFERPCASPCGELHVDFLARAFYLNDQRIEYFGTEATFGVEGNLAPVFRRSHEEWEFEAVGEFFFNQPYDRNILIDNAVRTSYARNFDIDPFQISQLYLAFRRHDLYFACGKMTTPFGRTWFPLFTNNWHDAPFIRTEAILWRETGVLLQWDPGNWVFTAMATNGGPDQDSNSSKGLVARVGYDAENFTLGASVKYQDGIGSEYQKTYNNHVGLDGRYTLGRWTLSGEWIYDQYGNRDPGLDLNTITWGRSLYFRELNKGPDQSISGTGYYVDLAYDGGWWSGHVNFGQYFPESIGDFRHDLNNTRVLCGMVYHHTPWSQFYGMLLSETDLPNAFEPTPRGRGAGELLLGWQFTL